MMTNRDPEQWQDQQEASATLTRPTVSVMGLDARGVIDYAWLAQQGYPVIAVDDNSHKIEQLLNGESPVQEPGTDCFLRAGADRSDLLATDKVSIAVLSSEFTLVSTPGDISPAAYHELDSFRLTLHTLALALRDKASYHLVVVRASLPRGTIEQVVIPIIEQYSGKYFGEAMGLCYMPEKTRKGRVLEDFLNVEKIKLWSLDRRSAKLAKSIFAQRQAALSEVSLVEAEKDFIPADFDPTRFVDLKPERRMPMPEYASA